MYECNRCLKSYMALKNLRKHVKNMHPGQLEELAKLPKRKYKCCTCDKQYNTVEFLKKHEKREHNLENSRMKEIYYCPICESKHFKRSNLIIHFEQDHQINIEETEHEFSTFKEFTNWKSKIESDTSSKFSKRGGSMPKRKTQFFYFLCNRSGYPGIKQKKLLSLWSKRSIAVQKGSNKINGLCPASITAKCKQKGKLLVRYVHTHVGHENDSGEENLKHGIDHDEIDHDKIDQDENDQDEIDHYQMNQDESDQDGIDHYKIEYDEIEHENDSGDESLSGNEGNIGREENLKHEIDHDKIDQDENDQDEIDHYQMDQDENGQDGIDHYKIEYDEIEHDEIDQDIDQLHSEWSCIIENVSTRDQIEVIKNHLKSMKNSIEILGKQNGKAPQNEIEYVFETSEEEAECDTQKIAPRSRAGNLRKLAPQRKLSIVWNE